MYQMLCALLATIVYGTATGHCQDAQAGMTAGHVSILHLQRHAPDPDARGSDRRVTVKATLGFPETGQGSLSRRHRRSRPHRLS